MNEHGELSRIEESALSTAVRAAIGRVLERAGVWSERSWGEEVARLQTRGRELIESGALVHQVHSLRIGESLADCIAALAMLPGGVRVCEVVFCARHYPFGTAGVRRYACPLCDGGATQDLTEQRDRRDVITYEGKPRL